MSFNSTMLKVVYENHSRSKCTYIIVPKQIWNTFQRYVYEYVCKEKLLDHFTIYTNVGICNICEILYIHVHSYIGKLHSGKK